MAAGTNGADKTAPSKLPVNVISQCRVWTPLGVCDGVILLR